MEALSWQSRQNWKQDGPRRILRSSRASNERGLALGLSLRTRHTNARARTRQRQGSKAVLQVRRGSQAEALTPSASPNTGALPLPRGPSRSTALCNLPFCVGLTAHTGWSHGGASMRQVSSGGQATPAEGGAPATPGGGVGAGYNGFPVGRADT